MSYVMPFTGRRKCIGFPHLLSLRNVAHSANDGTAVYFLCSDCGLEHFAQICSRWLGLGVGNLRLRRDFEKSGIFCPWLRCRSAVALRAMADKSVVDVYPLCPHPPVRPLRATLRVGYVAPLHCRNALPWPKSSRSTGYTFSQTALIPRRLHSAVTSAAILP